jgi:hypothetical protein
MDPAFGAEWDDRLLPSLFFTRYLSAAYFNAF